VHRLLKQLIHGGVSHRCLKRQERGQWALCPQQLAVRCCLKQRALSVAPVAV
jgi:hypothetical protein